MSIDIQIKNASVNGEWVEGDIVVHVDEGPINFSTTQHFKTKKDVEQEIDLGSGFKIVGTVSLKPPNQVCISGKLKQGFFSIDLGERCSPIGS